MVVHLNLVVVVNRPHVARAVLQTALSLIKGRFQKKQKNIESLTAVKPEGGRGKAGWWS